MLFTNFFVDAPLTIKLTNFFNEKIFKNNKKLNIFETLDDIKLLCPFITAISSFAAAMLAANIIVPYARNAIAKYFHKKAIKKLLKAAVRLGICVSSF